MTEQELERTRFSLELLIQANWKKHRRGDRKAQEIVAKAEAELEKLYATTKHDNAR